jgi:two-component system, NtrC family, nitrogen regulation sensor histidine kinase NtrY
MLPEDAGLDASVDLMQPNKRTVSRIGLASVALALISALATFVIFAGYSPIVPTNDVVLSLFLANIIIVLWLIGLVAWEIRKLLRARRRGAAAARLHIRIVTSFSLIAAVPALSMAVVAIITLDRGLNPAFMQDVRGFIQKTTIVADLYRREQCQSLLRDLQLTGVDLDRAHSLFDQDRTLLQDYFTSRARFLGFSQARIVKSDGAEIMDAGTKDDQAIFPEPSDFTDTHEDAPLCIAPQGRLTFVALLKLATYPEAFLYVARRVDPYAVQFPKEAEGITQIYDAFDAHRRNIQIAFATMFVLLALIILLSAVWLGLSFANRLVTPIRRLIGATDEVASGNLNVRVPVKASEGDIGHLAETFNKMTLELRLQQSRLIDANALADQRRKFTEAVLSGVPAAVFGIDGLNQITVVNDAAEFLLKTDKLAGAIIGQSILDLIPELLPFISEARGGRGRLRQSQLTLVRKGREGIFKLRISAETSNDLSQSLVVTLDDITELVTAQRTSAWADVARRIAHEIKNPLTPIQLSAERLKRKYGRVIVEDKDIFDQCTDTIVRQVEDIKRMVDEFSSFARMPKAKPETEDLGETIRQTLFLMRVGHPSIRFEDHTSSQPIIVAFDRRLISQALTNIIKNATEGIAAAEFPSDVQGVIELRVQMGEDGVIQIDVSDNGIGFPVENRHRLLEPYMTTRAEGTGLGLAIVAKIFEDHGGGIELLDGLPNPLTGKPGARVRLYFSVEPHGAHAKSNS